MKVQNIIGWKRVYRHIPREEGKDSQKMMTTCNERKQSEKVPAMSANKYHSGNKKSKAMRTLAKVTNHGQNPVKMQKKALDNRVKRSVNEMEEKVVPHTEVIKCVWKRRLGRFNL